MRGLLLDLDGVVYVGDEPVPGAVDAIDWLDHHQVPYRYLTNTSSRPREAIVEKLAGMGISTTADRILTPAVVSASWLRKRSVRPALFVPETTAEEFADLDPVLATLPEAKQAPDDGVGAVVVGDLGRGWDFATLNRAFRLLMAEPRPALLALGMTRYWRADDGLRLDAGAFVRALEYAAGVEAVVLGKPDPAFYLTAVDGLGLEPAEVVMVGDDVRADVAGAQGSGLSGVLVRTGKFSRADLDGDITPEAVLASIAELPEWWDG